MCVSFYTFFSFLTIIHSLRCALLIFQVFQCLCHIPGHTVFVSHFPRFSIFSPKSRFLSVYFLYFTFFTVSCHIPGPTLCFSICTIFSISLHFLCIRRKFSIFLVCHFSRHNPDFKVCISNLSRFSVILTIFQVIQCLCLIFHVCQFSRHNPGPTVFIFHISSFSLFRAIFQVLKSVFLLFHAFQCFLPYSRSYMCVSHFTRFLVF